MRHRALGTDHFTNINNDANSNFFLVAWCRLGLAPHGYGVGNGRTRIGESQLPLVATAVLEMSAIALGRRQLNAEY